jgi:hypothetical protein
MEPGHRLIAKLMAASSPIEKHLQEGGPLTVRELESLSLTISSLQTFLDLWKRRHKATSRSVRTKERSKGPGP